MVAAKRRRKAVRYGPVAQLDHEFPALLGFPPLLPPFDQAEGGPPARGSVDKLANGVAMRSPGNEFPGSVARSRLKPVLSPVEGPTAHSGSESPSGDFSSTQPGSSLPGGGSAEILQQCDRENRQSRGGGEPARSNSRCGRVDATLRHADEPELAAQQCDIGLDLHEPAPHEQEGAENSKCHDG